MASEPGTRHGGSGARKPGSETVEPGRVIGGKYRLKRHLADGGMGSVWVARHQVLGVDVAVKLMTPEIAGTELALARFEREAKASAQLKSHHIVRVHDYGLDNDKPFMVMELLEGEDLGSRLRRGGPMSLTTFAPLFRQIVKGLEVAHAAGIVHRDLKPSNVFLATEGTDEVVKIVDFGVARETKSSLVEDKTSSGVVVGSPHHMSPEQARGERVDHRSDIWALGVLAYRVLTGVKPFEAEALATLLLAIVAGPLPKATDENEALPSDVNRFFEMTLMRDPERRFQSASAMADALDAIEAGRELTPYLALPSAEDEGREEATIPSLDSVKIPVEPRDERTASREVGAVTAGVPSTSILGTRSKPWPWVALAVAVAFGAFYLGRAGNTAPAPPTEGSNLAARPEPPPEPTVAPHGLGSAEGSGSEDAPEPSGSAASSAPPPREVTPPPRPPVQPRPTPTHTVKPVPKPRPAPKVDPFTGIATP
jgi:eukaryotic-like serine/threonine-protein kinase